MPPPTGKAAKAPVVAAKTTASSRAKTVAAPKPKAAAAKKPATKSVRMAEKAEFVSAEAFDFGLPDFDDVAAPEPLPDFSGPMTRARRRTSVFVGRAPAPQTKKATTRKAKEAAEVPLEEASVAVPMTTQPMTSTAVKAGKKTVSPVLKLAEPLTPVVELQRMPSAEYKDSGARRKTVQKSQKKVAVEKKSPLSAIPLNLTPMKSAKKKVQKQSVMLATPGAPVDPINVLKKNLKKKVEAGMEAKVQQLPGNSSPYAMLNGETENGTPVERFVKLQDRAGAAKFVTGTPAKLVATAGRRRNVRTASKRNLQPQVEDDDRDTDDMAENDGSPKLPKRNRSSMFHGFPTPAAAAKAAKVSEELANQSDASLDENATPASPEHPATSPGRKTHLVTGELAKACIVM